MARTSTGATRTDSSTLFLLSASVLIELVGVLIAVAGFDEVADASPVGRAGTVLGLAVILILALAGAFVAWRGPAGRIAVVLGITLFAAAGLLTTMVVAFVLGGLTTFILAILLGHATFAVVMIGRALLRPAATER